MYTLYSATSVYYFLKYNLLQKNLKEWISQCKYMD